LDESNVDNTNMTDTPWPKEQDGEILAALLGNESALQFVRDVSFLSHAYDDLIDKDKPVSDENIHAMVWKMMVSLPGNAFFQENRALLQPLIITGIINWRASIDMEQTGCTEQLMVAHVIRHSIGDVLLMALAIVGGPAHAAKHAHRMRLLVQTGSWAEYEKEHTNA
jgi:hypothetical protein